MSPNPNTDHSSEAVGSAAEMGTSVRPNAPDEAPPASPTDERPILDVETGKPGRPGNGGEGSFEGTRVYANSVTAYMGATHVDQDRKEPVQHAAREVSESAVLMPDASSQSAPAVSAP